MKRIQMLFICLMLTTCYVFSQQPTDDLQKVKDALINVVLYSQALEKQNADLTQTINRIVEDLKAIKTVEQLDSLKVAYGIQELKPNTQK